MNGDFAHDRAIALADGLTKEVTTTPERITAAFRRLLGREPTMDELMQCESFVSEQTRHHESHPATRVDVRAWWS